MVKGIIKKEIKEKRGIILLGIILCVIPLFFPIFKKEGWLGGVYFTEDLPAILSLFCYCALAIIFPVLCAASSLSTEVEKKTIASLLTLPFSRGMIWRAKFLSSLILSYLFYGIFILINMQGPRISALEIMPVYHEYPIVWALIFLPLMTLSISFFICSLISSPIISAAISGIVSLILTVSSFSVFEYIEWGLQADQTIAIELSISLTFALASYIIFIRGEILKSGAALLKKGIIAFLISLVIGLFPIAAQITYRIYFPPGSIIDFAVVEPVKNNSAFLVLTAYSIEKEYQCGCCIWNDSRLCIVPVDGSKARYIPLVIQSLPIVQISPDEKHALVSCYKKRCWFNNLFRNMDNPNLYLINLDTLKIKKISNYSKEYRFFDIFWLDNEHFLLYSGKDLITYNLKGMPLLTGHILGNSTVMQQGGLIYIYTAELASPEYNQQIHKGKLTIDKYNPFTGEKKNIFTKISSDENTRKIITINFLYYPFLQDGRYCFYSKGEIGKGGSICCADLTSDISKTTEVKIDDQYPSARGITFENIFIGEKTNTAIITIEKEKTNYKVFNYKSGKIIDSAKLTNNHLVCQFSENKKTGEIAFWEVTDKKFPNHSSKEFLLNFMRIDDKGNLDKNEIVKLYADNISIVTWYDNDSVIIQDDKSLWLIKRDKSMKKIFEVNQPSN